MSNEQMYNFAIKKDEKGLIDFLQSGKDIDCCESSDKFPIMEPTISQLARQGNDDAVEFLLSHGANITFAAYGYIQASKINKLDELIDRGADIT